MKKTVILLLSILIPVLSITGCTLTDSTKEKNNLTEGENISQNSDVNEAGIQDDSISIQNNGKSIVKFGNYLFYTLQNRLFEADSNMENNNEIADMVNGNLWIFENQLYYASSNFLFSYNPETKEATKVYEGENEHSITLYSFNPKEGIAYITDTLLGEAAQTEILACDVRNKTFKSINQISYVDNVVLNNGKLLYTGSTAELSAGINQLFVYSDGEQSTLYTAENGNVKILGVHENWYYVFDYDTPGSIGDLSGVIRRINKDTRQVEDIVTEENFIFQDFQVTDTGIYYNNKYRSFNGEELGEEENLLPKEIRQYEIYDDGVYYIKDNGSQEAAVCIYDLETSETKVLIDSIPEDGKIFITEDIEKINDMVYFTAMKYVDTQNVGWRDDVPMYTDFLYYSYDSKQNKLTLMQDIKVDY